MPQQKTVTFTRRISPRTNKHGQLIRNYVASNLSGMTSISFKNGLDKHRVCRSGSEISPSELEWLEHDNPDIHISIN